MTFQHCSVNVICIQCVTYVCCFITSIHPHSRYILIWSNIFHRTYAFTHSIISTQTHETHQTHNYMKHRIISTNRIKSYNICLFFFSFFSSRPSLEIWKKKKKCKMGICNISSVLHWILYALCARVRGNMRIDRARQSGHIQQQQYQQQFEEWEKRPTTSASCYVCAMLFRIIHYAVVLFLLFSATYFV